MARKITPKVAKMIYYFHNEWGIGPKEINRYIRDLFGIEVNDNTIGRYANHPIEELRESRRKYKRREGNDKRNGITDEERLKQALSWKQEEEKYMMEGSMRRAHIIIGEENGYSRQTIYRWTRPEKIRELIDRNRGDPDFLVLREQHRDLLKRYGINDLE